MRGTVFYTFRHFIVTKIIIAMEFIQPYSKIAAGLPAPEARKAGTISQGLAFSLFLMTDTFCHLKTRASLARKKIGGHEFLRKSSRMNARQTRANSRLVGGKRKASVAEIDELESWQSVRKRGTLRRF